MMDTIMRPGLEGVIAAETRLSHVDGLLGELIIAGFRLEDIAPYASYEEMLYLLWHDHLPNQAELDAFTGQLASLRAIPAVATESLKEAAKQKLSVMDALRMAAGLLSLNVNPDDSKAAGMAMIAAFPTIVAAYWRLLHGKEPIAPKADLSHAANYLYMLNGAEPSAEQIRALDTYLNTVIDHGFNASTFAARVIIATDSDMVAAVVGAIGALKGSRHGGAPGPALDMVFEIGEASRAEAYIRAKLERGELLMGFGHRVYKVRDPRADVLNIAAQAFFKSGEQRALYDLARDVEATALRLLEEYKPGRKLQTNVEFYTALVLHGVGLDTELFTPTFAISRVGGWTAHVLEHQEGGRLIRPLSQYIGEHDRQWQALEDR